jgi:hypothetical protein
MALSLHEVEPGAPPAPPHGSPNIWSVWCSFCVSLGLCVVLQTANTRPADAVGACGRWLRLHRLCVSQDVLLSCCMFRRCGDTDAPLQIHTCAARQSPDAHVVSVSLLESATCAVSACGGL